MTEEEVRKSKHLISRRNWWLVKLVVINFYIYISTPTPIIVKVRYTGVKENIYKFPEGRKLKQAVHKA